VRTSSPWRGTNGTRQRTLWPAANRAKDRESLKHLLAFRDYWMRQRG
jgi:hypothetical protein